MTMKTVIYVDVDDTLVRSVGAKRIPVPRVLAGIRELRGAGATMYLWSSGGGEYARRSALELGIADCFDGFLPKPTVVVDDQPVQEWRGLTQLHPNEGVESVLARLRGTPGPCSG